MFPFPNWTKESFFFSPHLSLLCSVTAQNILYLNTIDIWRDACMTCTWFVRWLDLLIPTVHLCIFSCAYQSFPIIFFFLAKALSCFLVSLKSEILAFYPQFVFSGYRGELVLTCTVEVFFWLLYWQFYRSRAALKTSYVVALNLSRWGRINTVLLARYVQSETKAWRKRL